MALKVDLNEMLIFAEVVKSGSITQAAAQLGLPKSTVSRKLSQTEARMGVRLLKRSTRRLRLTEIGSAYYERCARIVQEIDGAQLLLDELQQKPRGPLRVSIPVEFAILWLSDHLAEFMRLYPEIQLNVDLNGRPVDPIAEDFDIAIRIGPLPDSNLVMRQLAVIERHVYATPAYVEARGEPRTPEELAKHDCIRVGTQSYGTQWIFSRGSEVFHVEPEGRAIVNNVSLAFRFLLADLGIAIMPEVIAAPFLGSGQLVRLLPDYHLEPKTALALLPSREHLPLKTRVFLDFLVDRLGRSETLPINLNYWARTPSR